MQDGSRPLRHHGLLSFCAGAVAVSLVVTSPPAYADDGNSPSQPIIVTGETVQTQATAVTPQPLPGTPGAPNPNQTPVAVQNSAPKVETVPGYSIPDVPGTFTSKITFFPVNPVAEQRVLAADTTGKALDPSRVRIAYLDKNNQLWVFFPGTGRLEKVASWPAVYPGAAQSGPATHTLSALFGGPGGPEWLEKARVIAVGIAAAVITTGAVALFGVVPTLAAVGSAVPLAW
jgi:hypothetical protein